MNAPIDLTPIRRLLDTADITGFDDLNRRNITALLDAADDARDAYANSNDPIAIAATSYAQSIVDLLLDDGAEQVDALLTRQRALSLVTKLAALGTVESHLRAGVHRMSTQYRVTVTRDRDWLMVAIPELDALTQAKTVPEVELSAREVIALYTGQEIEDVDLTIDLSQLHDAEETAPQ